MGVQRPVGEGGGNAAGGERFKIGWVKYKKCSSRIGSITNIRCKHNFGDRIFVTYDVYLLVTSSYFTTH